MALIPSRSSLPPTSSCTKSVFSMRMRKVSRASPSSRNATAQRILKTLRRVGKRLEGQEHIKMEDDKNDRREDIKAQERQSDVEHRQIQRAFEKEHTMLGRARSDR